MNELSETDPVPGNTSAYLRGALASQRGDLHEACEWLATAETLGHRAGLVIPSEALKRNRGRLLAGPEGQRVIDEADAALSSLGIVNPARWAATFAAGIVPA